MTEEIYSSIGSALDFDGAGSIPTLIKFVSENHIVKICAIN